jgi:hypothetical protein
MLRRSMFFPFNLVYCHDHFQRHSSPTGIPSVLYLIRFHSQCTGLLLFEALGEKCSVLSESERDQNLWPTCNLQQNQGRLVNSPIT